MKLKTSLIVALSIGIIGLIAWESYWRSQDYEPNLNDDKELWANQRAKVNNASEQDILLLGSSRILFDIQLNEFEAETGIRPVQLAIAGASPLPVFHDLVHNTGFKGTIILGVTTVLTFSTLYPKAMPWDRPQSKVDHFYNRTYAQRLNHKLSLPLQNNFVFMSADEELYIDDIDLKSLLRRIEIGERVPETVYLVNFQNTTEDRNTSMLNKTVTDSSFTRRVTNFWEFVMKVSPPPDVAPTMEYLVNDAKDFINRGGNLVFLRCPSSGPFRGGEAQILPRETVWDELLRQTNAKGYHYEDYDQFKNLVCPEWSHLSLKDAKFFTTELAKIMIEDNVLTNQKTN